MGLVELKFLLLPRYTTENGSARLVEGGIVQDCGLAREGIMAPQITGSMGQCCKVYHTFLLFCFFTTQTLKVEKTSQCTVDPSPTSTNLDQIYSHTIWAKLNAISSDFPSNSPS